MDETGGITLSARFIIIMVTIAIVLVFALIFFQQAQRGTELTAGVVQAQLIQQIEKELVETRSKVSLPIYEATLKRGETFTFAMGVKNYLGLDSDFSVEIAYDKSIETNTNQIVQITNADDFFLANFGPYPLKDKERKIVRIPIRIPEGTEKGTTHIFNVKATCDLTGTTLCNPYGYAQSIRVHVE
jgi:uncharacterized membrane protein